MLELVAMTLYTLALAGSALWTEQKLQRAPVLPMTANVQNGDRVAVIVPARNEAHNIARCVRSLLDQFYPALDLIVVDDQSTDATPEIVAALQSKHPRGAHLHLLRTPELPPGWFGKPHAAWIGAQHPAARTADWLLFVDADTRSHPALVSSALAFARNLGVDLLSIFSQQALCTVWERLIMPHIFYVIAISFDWRRVNDPSDPLAIANGQFILIRRAIYDAVGGHRAVRAAIAEDQQLAEITKRAGYRLFLADGRELMTTRMYTSLGEIWEGWSKNAYLGLGERAYLLALAALGGVAGGIGPFLLASWALRRLARHPGRSSALMSLEAFGLLGLILRNRWIVMRELDVPRWYTFTLPLGALLSIGIAFAAWWQVVSGRGVTWKGRRYARVGAS
ncbi:MAG: glycosyltransferase [Ardenticatenaceae bacterium]|nr:glycosyltransferase [Ardenticatenaceae bacterium]